MKNPIFSIILIMFPFISSASPGDNFRPCQTVALSATTTSSSVSLNACGASTLQVDCYNSGSTTVFVTGGVNSATSSVPTGTASNGNYHIAGGSDKVFDLGVANTIAAIAASGTDTVYCSSGSGQ